MPVRPADIVGVPVGYLDYLRGEGLSGVHFGCSRVGQEEVEQKSKEAAGKAR